MSTLGQDAPATGVFNVKNFTYPRFEGITDLVGKKACGQKGDAL